MLWATQRQSKVLLRRLPSRPTFLVRRRKELFTVAACLLSAVAFFQNAVRPSVQPWSETIYPIAAATTQTYWWDDHVESLSRVYDPLSISAWCQPRNLLKWEDLRSKGLFFVKINKASSSTGAAITMRIARNVAARLGWTTDVDPQRSTPECYNIWRHGEASRMGYQNRNRSASLLWTIVREPKQRAMSQFYHFELARKGTPPTEENLITYARNSINAQTRVLRQYPHKRQTADSTLLRKEIFEFYNFIALTERLEESLAVMTLLFGLEDSDVIVLSAKTSGGYDDGRFKETCFRIPSQRTLPAAVQQYLDTNFTENNLDSLIYAAASRSLDRTIDHLGRQVVEERVLRQRRLRRIADDTCRPQAVFACSDNGTLQAEASQKDCYAQDIGCAYQCVDRILAEQHERS